MAWLVVPSHFQQMSQQLQQFQQKGLHCDTVLVAADGHEAKIHSILAASCSQVFAGLLSLAPFSRKEHIVHCPIFTKQLLDIFVKYLYSGKICVTSYNVLKVQRMFEQLKVEHARKLCEEFGSTIHAEGCVDENLFPTQSHVLEEEAGSGTCILTSVKCETKPSWQTENGDTMDEDALLGTDSGTAKHDSADICDEDALLNDELADIVVPTSTAQEKKSGKKGKAGSGPHACLRCKKRFRTIQTLGQHTVICGQPGNALANSLSSNDTNGDVKTHNGTDKQESSHVTNTEGATNLFQAIIKASSTATGRPWPQSEVAEAGGNQQQPVTTGSQVCPESLEKLATSLQSRHSEEPVVKTEGKKWGSAGEKWQAYREKVKADPEKWQRFKQKANERRKRRKKEKLLELKQQKQNNKVKNDTSKTGKACDGHVSKTNGNHSNGDKSEMNVESHFDEDDPMQEDSFFEKEMQAAYTGNEETVLNN